MECSIVDYHTMDIPIHVPLSPPKLVTILCIILTRCV